jgi:hypothetical protein
MHGSVNWRIGLDFSRAPRFEWKPTGFREDSIKEQVHFSLDLLDFDAWRDAEPISGEVEPFLVLPGFGKAYDIRAISTLWYKPETVFSFTKDIYIIGLALNPDDFFVRSFLLATLPYLDSFHSLDRTITIINPDERIRENYEFIKKGVKFVQEPFGEKHVEAMENSVGT